MPRGRRTHSQREITVGDFGGRVSIFGGQIGSEDNGEGETSWRGPEDGDALLRTFGAFLRTKKGQVDQ